MPKIISEKEKQRVKDVMFEKAIVLIKDKGITKLTVEDITKAVGISKGAFYMYYKSKEELIYEVVRESEKNLFSKLKALDYKTNKKEQIKKALYEFYLAEDSLALYTTSSEYLNLLRKLPSEIYEIERQKVNNYFQKTLEVLDVDTENCDINVLAQIMEALQFVVSNKKSYTAGRKKALTIIVNSLAEYLAGDAV